MHTYMHVHSERLVGPRADDTCVAMGVISLSRLHSGHTIVELLERRIAWVGMRVRVRVRVRGER